MKVNEIKTIRPLNTKSLFNLLQDQLHLIILDFRKKGNFTQRFIRKSYNFDPITDDTTETLKLVNFIIKTDENAKINEEKYKLPKIRRIVFILEKEQTETQKIKEYLENTNLFDAFDQKLIFENQFLKFVEKYPFLTLEIPENYQKHPFEAIQKYLITEKSKELLYANASFPIEIIENSIFLGNNFHSTNKKLLQDLKIGVCIEIKKVNKGNALLAPIENEPNFYKMELDIDAIIDFDGILEQISQEIGEKTLLFTGENFEMPSGIVIAYLMKKTKQNLNFASLRVFSSIGQTQVDRLLYNQLINYEPGKITFVKV